MDNYRTSNTSESQVEQVGKFKERKDVMNKTLLRFIRKFFTSEYKELFPQIRSRAY